MMITVSRNMREGCGPSRKYKLSRKLCVGAKESLVSDEKLGY